MKKKYVKVTCLSGNIIMIVVGTYNSVDEELTSYNFEICISCGLVTWCVFNYVTSKLIFLQVVQCVVRLTPQFPYNPLNE